MPYYDLLSLLIIVVFLCGIVAACVWEKRPIQSYYVPAEGKEYKPSPIARTANNEAQSCGYRHCVICHDGKGILYRIRYDFQLAPDNRTLAYVGSGTLALIPVNGIWLYSRTRDGRILCTTNEKGNQDISGIEEMDTWPELPFNALVPKHEARLAETEVEPFDADSALAGYFEIRRKKADALVARNLAYYIDDEQAVWRYTLKGALMFYSITVWLRPMLRFFRSVGLVRA